MSELDLEIEELKNSLVNSQMFSDVTFTFPSTETENNDEQQTIFGHKAILATNSVVFAKMLSGNFPDDKEVRIEDIKYGIFLKLVKYIYTGALELTKINMAELLYAAQKYMLKAVKTKTETFMLANIGYSNLLEILNARQCFENSDISAKCCNIFCDDPLYFLTDEEFFKLSVESFKMIVNQQEMNCSELQLKTFAIKWLNKKFKPGMLSNKDEFNQQLVKCKGIEGWQLGPKSLFHLTTRFYCGHFEVLSFAKNRICISNEQNIFLHGIGINVGVFPNHEQPEEDRDMQAYFDETIKVSVFEHDRLTKTTITDIYDYFEIKQKTTVSIECVLFEKVELTSDFSIIVDFGRKKPRTVISRKAKTDNVENNLNVLFTSIDEQDITSDYSCCAYILTSAAGSAK